MCSQEAIRSLIVSQYALQTNEIAVFHHTGCGMTGFEEEMERTVRGRMREELERVNASEDEKKEIEQMGFLGLVGTPTDSVRRDVDLIRQHPLFRNTIITGWVHDIETGRVSSL
jgi:carbonic anhydrase